MVSTFRIVLSQDEGKKYDVHDTREFDLALDSKFTIGRASKNTSRGYLVPAKHNLYIDSPVVSREHAILTANARSGIAHVYITDTGSMHGTLVNGTPLVPNTPKQLSNGDKLQFGIDVNRGTSYFLAYEYIFRAELSNPEVFSRGFTVPEAESEEEELDFVQSRRGSQMNPLILDDSDAESVQFEENGDVTMAQLGEDAEVNAAIDAAIDAANSEEDEDAAYSIAESDVESDAPSTDDATGYSPQTPVFGTEAEYIEEVAATKQVQATPIEQGRSSATLSASFEPSPLVVQPPMAESPNLEGFGYPTLDDVVERASTQLPSISTIREAYESGPFDSTWAPPLPPRPSQKRQKIWDEATPLSQECCNDCNDQLFAGESDDILISDPYVSYNPLLQTQQPGNDCSSSTTAPTASRIQTPPPTLTADIVSSTPSPPARRTGLSITEIAEEQPPTPTSVNSRKRGASDAFEEEAEQTVQKTVVALDAVMEAAQEPTAKAVVSEMTIRPTIEQIVPHSPRPIAQPRSILKRALRAAGVLVPATAVGAAFTITALATLPESFFTVA